MIPITMNNIAVDWSLIYVCFFSLLMTTFFEEFLFRGFIKTQLEKKFSFIIDIIFSGLLFSIYHIGYPGFRSIEDLILYFLLD
ncbi:hypothetical protein ALNOE001_03270 [Candidatus Methanobinarius endosymbioticus]|uniref:CAAX prenyl protease 2/Lysostaphin resistance protein A-like domain-containing protein n=1 Tax=Candidatus Methanobinarius endosymbioticus TaxID=2006182 RepID=A0A366MF44_9EURY|nr:hypothetical protein ALNOE001_03270 [Candidatus Methanobinarius endosymbioticus]